MKDILRNNSTSTSESTFDSYVLDSIGLPPNDYNGPDYNIRALDKYCKARNIDPSELSDDELKQFEV